jgi:hypothetical protein
MTTCLSKALTCHYTCAYKLKNFLASNPKKKKSSFGYVRIFEEKNFERVFVIF